MELWTEYEGTTIDGVFPLTRLLRPEGSSAFFTTSNEAGMPRLLRLIETRSNEDIASRWRAVAELDHPNILKLEEFGQVMVDETSLAYAVMEPGDANLDEVVNDHHVTVLEAKQLAASLVSVLEALHLNGYIHQHVQTVNVVAVGEVVKLQCDCIREAPEGELGRQLKQRDVRDLAFVLLQALTQEQALDPATRRLPAPFDQIVPKGISGEWGLTQIAAALEEYPVPQELPFPADLPELRGSAEAQSSSPESPQTVQPNRVKEVPSPGPVPGTGRMEWRHPLVAVTAVLILLILAGLIRYVLSLRTAVPGTAPAAVSAPVGDTTANVHATGNVANPSVAPLAPTATLAPQESAASVGEAWRVVAYTYRHEAQAKKKAASVAQKHHGLEPEVFRPDESGPYLVTVGGAMSKSEAFALVKRARHEGLPRDTYAQNYKSSGR